MRMFSSKRASFNVLLAIIITLLVGIIVLVIGYQIHQNSKDTDDAEKCRLSIFANHQLSKVRQESKGLMDFPVAFDCPRKFLKVTLDDVEKYRRIDDDLVKTMVAEEMKRCWDKTGGGKLDPFKASSTVDESFCMVCSDVVFAPDFLEKAHEDGYSLKGFQYWMATHKLPGIKMPLLEYLTGEEASPEDLAELAAGQTDDAYRINIDEKYVIVWRVQKYEPGWWERMGAAIGGAAMAALGVVLLPVSAGTSATMIAAGAGAVIGYHAASRSQGNENFDSGVWIIPEERLSGSMLTPEQLLRRLAESAASLGNVWGPNRQLRKSEMYFCTVMIN